MMGGANIFTPTSRVKIYSIVFYVISLVYNVYIPFLYLTCSVKNDLRLLESLKQYT